MTRDWSQLVNSMIDLIASHSQTEKIQAEVEILSGIQM